MTMADEPLSRPRYSCHVTITLASGGTITFDGKDLTPDAMREMLAIVSDAANVETADG